MTAAAAHGQQPPAMQLSFGNTAVTVANVPAGHRVVVLGVGHYAAQWGVSSFARMGVVNESGGRATFEPDGGLSKRSIWFAVDVESGAYIAARASRAGVSLPFPAATLLRDGSGVIEKIRESRALVDYLVVRPGVGAWTLTISDGGAADEDHANNGFFIFAPTAMTPLTGAAPPSTLAVNDVVISIDRMELEYSATRIDQ